MSTTTPLNRNSAAELGWDPTWLGLPTTEWGQPLEDQIRTVQALYGLAVTGVVDARTWTRLLGDLRVGIGAGLELGVEEKRPKPLGDYIVHAGKRLPIPWPRVVSCDEPGGRAIERYYTTKDGKQRSRWCKRGTERYGPLQYAGLHWTATTSAAHTWRYAWRTKRSVSTHFEIDCDGTIYQLVDTQYAAYHFGHRWFNHCSVGVDLTLHPGKVGKAAQTNKRLVEQGYPARPVMEGWRIGSRKIKPFVGPYPVQLDALRALMWALHEHLQIPLVSPGDVPSKPQLIRRFKGRFRADNASPGWYHHCYAVSNRWDTLGVHLTSELEAAQHAAKPPKKRKKAAKKRAKAKKGSK